MYGNPVPEWSEWPLAMYLSGDEIEFARRIQLCQRDEFYFAFCEESEPVPSD